MCGLLGLLAAYRLTGVVLGMTSIVIGQGLYCRYVEKAKLDAWRLLKISKLSRMTVFLSMMLICEAWHRTNERDMDGKGNKIEKENRDGIDIPKERNQRNTSKRNPHIVFLA